MKETLKFSKCIYNHLRWTLSNIKGSVQENKYNLQQYHKFTKTALYLGFTSQSGSVYICQLSNKVSKGY